MKSIKIINPEVAIKLTKDEAVSLGIDITQDEIRGEVTTKGPWDIVTGYRALCISNEYDRSGMFTKIISTTIFGQRRMCRVKQSGYSLDGYVSIKGKDCTAFTSSTLFDVEGKLINVATINVRIK
jgi:hypothetical protein